MSSSIARVKFLKCKSNQMPEYFIQRAYETYNYHTKCICIHIEKEG